MNTDEKPMCATEMSEWETRQQRIAALKEEVVRAAVGIIKRTRAYSNTGNMAIVTTEELAGAVDRLLAEEGQ